MWLKKIESGRRPETVNVERLNKMMDRDGLAAIVVRGGHNVTYLSGVSFHGTLARHLDWPARSAASLQSGRDMGGRPL